MRHSINRLKLALSNNEFFPFYQPIVSNHSKKIMGCEVLARWIHPARGLLTAENFICSIERAGLAEMLTMSMAKTIYDDTVEIQEWVDENFFLTININLSLVMKPGFRHFLLALNTHFLCMGITPVFEIIEREDIRSFPGVEIIFADLVGQGLQFAVDDFGMGYACEATIRATQATIIKIDRRFAQTESTARSDRLLASMINLAQQTGAKIIVEGIENERQALHLQTFEVDYVQGYYYGPPMPFGLFRYQLRKECLSAV